MAIADKRIMNTFGASYISPRSGLTATDCRADFLYPFGAPIGCSTPSRMLNGTAAPSECRTEGKAVPFFCSRPLKSLSVMSYTERTAFEVKISSHTCTPTERNTVSRAAFQIEKNAKNKAYAFILQHGLLEDFRHFVNSLPDGTDPHGLCVDALIRISNTYDHGKSNSNGSAQI